MKKIYWIALSTLILISACNRKDPSHQAGKGGQAILKVVPKHHEVYKNLVDAKAYIKYNTSDAPTSFDDSVACSYDSGMPTATFSGLKTGQYYIACTAYDTSIKQAVKGALPYEIKTENTINITVPVTETH